MFLPQQREKVEGYPGFPYIYLMSFICTFAKHWLIMKKTKTKQNKKTQTKKQPLQNQHQQTKTPNKKQQNKKLNK